MNRVGHLFLLILLLLPGGHLSASEDTKEKKSHQAGVIQSALELLEETKKQENQKDAKEDPHGLQRIASDLSKSTLFDTESESFQKLNDFIFDEEGSLKTDEAKEALQAFEQELDVLTEPTEAMRAQGFIAYLENELANVNIEPLSSREALTPDIDPELQEKLRSLSGPSISRDPFSFLNFAARSGGLTDPPQPPSSSPPPTDSPTPPVPAPKTPSPKPTPLPVAPKPSFSNPTPLDNSTPKEQDPKVVSAQPAIVLQPTTNSTSPFQEPQNNKVFDLATMKESKPTKREMRYFETEQGQSPFTDNPPKKESNLSNPFPVEGSETIKQKETPLIAVSEKTSNPPFPKQSSNAFFNSINFEGIEKVVTRLSESPTTNPPIETSSEVVNEKFPDIATGSNQNELTFAEDAEEEEEEQTATDLTKQEKPQWVARRTKPKERASTGSDLSQFHMEIAEEIQ